MTAISEPDVTLDHQMRTVYGTPKRWLREGQFGVLLSSAPDGEVIDQRYDARAGSWEPITRADHAADHGAMIRRSQPGIEFEVVRLEDGVWRGFLGRTPKQAIDVRWSRS